MRQPSPAGTPTESFTPAVRRPGWTFVNRSRRRGRSRGGARVGNEVHLSGRCSTRRVVRQRLDASMLNLAWRAPETLVELCRGFRRTLLRGQMVRARRSMFAVALRQQWEGSAYVDGRFDERRTPCNLELNGRTRRYSGLWAISSKPYIGKYPR